VTGARALATIDQVAPARQADSDAQLLALWLHDRPASTRRAYARDVARFLVFVAKPLPTVVLGDLHAYADSLVGLAAATRARYLSAVKSLLAFGHRLGYLPVDVGALVRLPAIRSRLAERILDEATTQRLFALEPSARNRAVLRLLYAGGLRRSELVDLRWRDL
jgi:integrase/recombinase XerD